jgi:hypothetical protein
MATLVPGRPNDRLHWSESVDRRRDQRRSDRSPLHRIRSPLGFGGMYMLNVFAYRSTNPSQLRTAADPVGRRNNAVLRSTCRRCNMVLACWGVWGGLFDPDRTVIELLADVPMHCLGMTRGGQLKHPLYLRSTTTAIRLPIGIAR